MVAINSEEKLLNTGRDISQIDFTLKAIITCEELFKRWPGVSAQKFAQMVNVGKPTPYICERETSKGETEKSYICRVATFDAKLPPYHDGFNGFWLYRDIVFSIKDVQQIEELMPALLSETQASRNEYIHANSREGIENHHIECKELVDRWCCSEESVLLIIALLGDEFPVSMRDELTNNMSIDNYYMSFYDLLDWESTHAEKIHTIKLLFNLINLRNTSDNNKKKHNEQSDTTISIANTSMHLCADRHITTESITHKKTDNASIEILKKALKSVKVDLGIAVSLACTLAKDCKPLSTLAHAKMWAKMCAEVYGVPENCNFRRDSFRAFRRGLPDYLKLKNKAKS